MPKVYCIDERGVIEEPYQTPENIARKKGFIVKVQELYKWKNVPVAKVLFYDCQKFAQKFGTGTADTKTMESFFSVTWLHMVERVVADQQVKYSIFIEHSVLCKLILLLHVCKFLSWNFRHAN